MAVTGLDITQVKASLDTLISENLIAAISDIDKENDNEKLPKEMQGAKGKTKEFYELREELEGFLVVNLDPKKAKSCVKELLACSSEEELKITARKLAETITILNDEHIGQEMLELIENMVL